MRVQLERVLEVSLRRRGAHHPAFWRCGDPEPAVGPGLEQLLGHCEKGSKRFQHLLKTSSLAHNEKDSREPLEMGKHLLLEVVTG